MFKRKRNALLLKKTEDLIKSLNKNEVDFVIIGRTARLLQTGEMATFDVDIAIRPTESNAKKTQQVLKTFGSNVSPVRIEDLLKKRIQRDILITDLCPYPLKKTYIFRILNGISFDQVWGNKVKKKYGNTPVYCASLDDLERMEKGFNL